MHFHKYTVTIYDPQVIPLLQGWQDNTGASIWCFALRPQISTLFSMKEDGQAFTVVPKSVVKSSNLKAFSAYDLPSVEILVRYLHASAGFPVKSTCLDYIKAGNFASFPGLKYQNAAKYCPSSIDTLKGHMEQTRQNVHSTNFKPAPTTRPSAKLQARPVSPPSLPDEITNEMYSWETPISKLYLDDTG